MEILYDVLRWGLITIIGFALFAIAIRIIAKISIKTFFDEKFKTEKKGEYDDGISTRQTRRIKKTDEERD